MSRRPTLVVVGAGLAGAKAAEGARAAGFDGRVVLVGDEPGAPYERPPLSKDVLRGESEPASTHVHDDGFYAEHDIELVDDEVVALDTVGRRVELAGAGPLAFDTAVLATGAAPRRLTVPGADLDGVHHLRTLDDALHLRDALGAATRVAVVGGGWIGCEVAASARQLGVDVVLVEPSEVPLQRVLGPEVGAVFARLHADQGVDLRLGRGVERLVGDARVEGVVLDDGRTEAVDVVVAGIGVEPRLGVAETATGLRVTGGVVVDGYLETNIAGIYAAGDVANAWHPRFRRHLRVDHWANALNQGLRAGANAAGERATYDRLPYFYSDQYDLSLEYVGHADGRDRVEVHGDVESRRFLAFWRRDGRVEAAMAVNVADVVDDLKAVVSAGAIRELPEVA